MKKALLTGLTGQDGSYLAELLLSKEYEVHGLKRRSSSFNTDRVDHIYHDFHEHGAKLLLHYADLSDGSSLPGVLADIRPDEVYNLGAQSHVKVSFETPEYTGDVAAMGTLRLLEAIRRANLQCRFYQASSSEMFGSTPPPQNESSSFRPRSPYACAKAFAHHITVNYRESYGMHASCGILFNHESPRRGETFVTRKITRAVAHIKFGLQKKLFLGNLEVRRDWGYAPDYVDACGVCSSRTGPATMSSARAKCIACANLWSAPLPSRTWTGTTTFASTRATTGLPRSTHCRQTTPKPDLCWVGNLG